MKIFLKSYEDNTYIGGTVNICPDDLYKIQDTTSWNEAIELLKKNIIGEFRVYEDYGTMYDMEHPLDCIIFGLS